AGIAAILLLFCGVSSNTVSDIFPVAFGAGGLGAGGGGGGAAAFAGAGVAVFTGATAAAAAEPERFGSGAQSFAFSERASISFSFAGAAAAAEAGTLPFSSATTRSLWSEGHTEIRSGYLRSQVGQTFILHRLRELTILLKEASPGINFSSANK